MEACEFNRQLVELRTIIADGIAYFAAWRGLTVEDDALAQALNRYRGLLLPAQIALRSQALMQFAKVFDKHPRAISLRNLLIAACRDPSMLTPYATHEELQDAQVKLKNSERQLVLLKRLRDTRLAHHDAVVAGSTSLQYGEVTRLVDDVKSMYNLLTRGHDRSVFSFERLARDGERHGSEVVSIICRERDRVGQGVIEAEDVTPDGSDTLLRKMTQQS